MKFGKQFTSQMVQEWQEAYMNYNYLKSILKDMLRSKQPNSSLIASTPKGSLKRRVSLYKAFSGLKHRGSPRNDHEDEVILVRAEVKEGSEEEFYQTLFLKSAEEGGEQEFLFFKKLDNEFNKMNGFYMKKVSEVMEEAEDLSKQMNALIALRVKVDNVVGLRGSVRNEISTSDSLEHHMNDTKLDVIQEIEMSHENHLEDKSGSHVEQPNAASSSLRGFRPASLEILDHVKINVITPETPISTVKGLLLASNNDLSFSKKELRKAEEQMKLAFKEFYHKLHLLKRFSFLNLLAFSKIMKKYDKVTTRNASKEYLKVVDKSYFGNSEEVNRLMEKVEIAFIKHFANGNRRKGMNTLKPSSKRERHRATFLLGLLTGCSLALIVALLVLIHARKLLNTNTVDRNRYMDNIFPLYSLFGFIILHMLMYAANIYLWGRFKINYAFIFGFKQGTELGYRKVFLLSSGLAVMALAVVLSNLNMEMDPRTKSFSEFTELVPLGLVAVLLLITFCPFNIIYRSSRFFLIQTAFHCICAPLYKVNLPDHFFADQLTSQVWKFHSY